MLKDLENISAIDLLTICLNSRSETAWEELVRRLQPIIASVIWNALRVKSGVTTRDAVDDLVQQTFLKLCDSNCRILRSIDLRSDPELFGYVRKVALNLLIDHLRASKPTVAIDDSVIDISKPRGDLSLFLDDVERHLKICAQDNYNRDRTVFWLHYRSGFTTARIAAFASFGLTESGVESLLVRLRRCLRKSIAGNTRREGISPRSSLSVTGEGLEPAI